MRGISRAGWWGRQAKREWPAHPLGCVSPASVQRARSVSGYHFENDVPAALMTICSSANRLRFIGPSPPGLRTEDVPGLRSATLSAATGVGGRSLRRSTYWDLVTRVLRTTGGRRDRTRTAMFGLAGVDRASHGSATSRHSLLAGILLWPFLIPSNNGSLPGRIRKVRR